ncbi:MAG: preprotein translocase subunit SecE [Methanosaeta sp. PtaU1.Bin028]|nr:MAG: preprotein translocase subunit SecE [Methanosaeta sp. PtaU1.Bin028]
MAWPLPIGMKEAESKLGQLKSKLEKIDLRDKLAGSGESDSDTVQAADKPLPRQRSGGQAPEVKTKNNKDRSSLKSKLELSERLDDLGLDAPSTDVQEYIRVLKLARKPTREEFTMIGKVSMTGIFLIGMIGFVIYALLTELPRSV